MVVSEDELDELEDELELEEVDDDVLLSEELTEEDSSESPKGQMAWAVARSAIV